ncbi:bifunctional riboflavin kinase/FAD synthetase [Flavobacterium orientale]|uniref:bifunctional riboflavin kinase/FAD synthetase n=1 Tax=Flavobacterium orientale TaxID=1756020 RepID=UPI00166B4BA7|nr:bifunctional riboflavin kinase/FAD synthetase [Flavobacterium orientale]
MKLFHSIQKFTSKKQTIVTLGTFDGVHLGHRKIIDRLVATAKQESCESVILTFFPHPRMVLQDGSSVKLLNTMDEKAQLLEQLEVDNLIIHPFDQEFSRLTAEEFVEEVLVKQLNLKKIIIGYDHRFGRNRTANIDDLKEFGKQFNFEVEEISAQEIDDVAVSSTKIRNALEEGNIPLANSYLSYPYFLTGLVTKGKSIGRTIDFPTANLDLKDNHKLIPKKGVYIVSSTHKEALVFGMMNIGYNPTVKGDKKTIEVHFFNFNEDLYNQKIQIAILNRIRDEIKFDTLDQLKTQLESDKKTAMAWLEIQD